MFSGYKVSVLQDEKVRIYLTQANCTLKNGEDGKKELLAQNNNSNCVWGDYSMWISEAVKASSQRQEGGTGNTPSDSTRGELLVCYLKVILGWFKMYIVNPGAATKRCF